LDILQSIILGLIQGVTEFLPVSSSGHLYILPKIFNAEGYLSSTSFILFLHFGTLLALLVYYRKLIIRYISSFYKRFARKDKSKIVNKDISAIRNVIAATIPAGILGFIGEKFLSTLYDERIVSKDVALLVIAIPMIIMGFIFVFEKKILKAGEKEIDELSLKNSLIVGFAQCVAFIRGVSRSGITLLAGQFNGLSRVSAAEFSFLMSIPITAASSIFEVVKFLKDSSEFSSNLLPVYLVGMISSFIFGMIAIDFLIKFLRTKSLSIFGYYRIYFGLFLIFLIIFK
jgi:undecaprenyl-diphosphatase